MLAWTAMAVGPAGCETPPPPRQPANYPPGTLPVRYESASDYSTCLVASVVMAANYLLGERRFDEADMREELRVLGLDETRIGDLQQYLETKGLRMFALKGDLGARAPTGLRHWVKNKKGRYPVICVVNRDQENDPAFNHAVVVIGISPDPVEGTTDIIYYFDPSSEDTPLHAPTAAAFEEVWARGEHAMMIIVSKPEGRAGAAAGSGG